MTTLFLDLETYSETPIKHGVHAYAEKAEVLLFAYAIDDGPVHVVDMANPNADDPPFPLMRLDRSTTTFVMHNSGFDRVVLKHALGIDIPVERIHDTMVQALAHSLPGSLGTLSAIFGLPADQAKDKEGKKLINLFCKPRPQTSKERRATRDTHPREWQQFIEYARLDIEATRAIYKKLPPWNYSGRELSLWGLDQRINDRGFAVDIGLARAAISAVDQTQRTLATRTRSATGGAVESASRRDALLAYILREHGVELPDMQAGTLERRIADPDLPEPVRELLAIRLQASTTSTTKYKALINAVSSDGRLRGTLQFCGASRTGRWAGRTFQPQNLARPNMKQADIDYGIEAIKAGCADLLFENVMELASNAVRGCIVAPEGKKLVISDLSNIEGRVLAWLAGEEWKLKAFREFDQGTGHDLYKLAYARSFSVPPEEVTKDQRQLGKVQELALGYQGAVGAFSSMAALYGMELPEERVLQVVKAWRKANPNITSFWYELEDAVKQALVSDGELRCRKLTVRRDKGWLRIILPSGRSLCYPAPRVENGKLSYMGMNSYTKRWERIATYGGKLVENCTQAVARDVMAANMQRIEDAGYEIVLSVHDELITESSLLVDGVTKKVHDTGWLLPSGEVVPLSKHLSALLATNPEWSEGLPLAAGGFETYRYRKD